MDQIYLKSGTRDAFLEIKKNHILKYIIYEYLKKGFGWSQPTCLVRVHCAMHKHCLSNRSLKNAYFFLTGTLNMLRFLVDFAKILNITG